MDENYWAAVRTMRLRLAEFLDSLSPQEWNAASLCDGWRVRDVAGHLAIVPTITTWEMVAIAPRAGFDPNRINTLVAIKNGSRLPGEIVAEIRAHAGDRGRAAMLDDRNALFDVIVHSQDIAVPLGREFAVPAEYSRAGLDRVWVMGWPFRARRKFAGLSLTATDIEWQEGSGPQISGSALSLLLLLTGRTATVIDSLQGTGVTELSNRS